MSNSEFKGEIMIARSALIAIVESHLNENVFRVPHRVVDVVTHKQGDHSLTVTIEPVENIMEAIRDEIG